MCFVYFVVQPHPPCMFERENIFTRIREALTVRTHAQHGDSPSSTVEQRRVLPLVGATSGGQFALFQQNAVELRADFQIVADVLELETALLALSRMHGWRKIAAHEGELSGAAARTLGLPVLSAGGGYDKNELAACDAGITECDALIAQTGSVIVTSRDSGGRALSVLPPHHVVLVRWEQLVRDLSAGFDRVQKKYAPAYPSMISVVTGPSRTGDIERILVLGAHGPKKLTIICW